MRAVYGAIHASMPKIFKDGYVTAIPTAEVNCGGMCGAASGECYELSGPFGKTTVMVSEFTPPASAGTVDAGRGFFDLGVEHFKVLQLPLEASGTAPVVIGFTVMNGTSTTLPNVWLDEMEFLER